MRPSGRGGRLALLPFFVALIAYGGTKQSGGVESGGVGELGSNHGMHGIDGMDTNHVFGV